MISAFEIGTVRLENGGRLGICRLPGLRGNLTFDLAAIREWKPVLVLSMTEQHEMDENGCGGLGTALEDCGINWLHLPIRDYGGPVGDSALNWPGISRRLHSLLDEAKGVLLHCRGGQGRSGMIALRLLVERGENPALALERLRAVRSGVVETEEQLQWASDPSATNSCKR